MILKIPSNIPTPKELEAVNDFLKVIKKWEKEDVSNKKLFRNIIRIISKENNKQITELNKLTAFYEKLDLGIEKINPGKAFKLVNKKEKYK